MSSTLKKGANITSSSESKKPNIQPLHEQSTKDSQSSGKSNVIFCLIN